MISNGLRDQLLRLGNAGICAQRISVSRMNVRLGCGHDRNLFTIGKIQDNVIVIVTFPDEKVQSSSRLPAFRQIRGPIMKRHAPQVREYMTHLPVEAERCETAGDAETMMRQHAIHHLPVMSGSQLKGIVSQRELLEARLHLGKQFAATPLERVCTKQVLTVSPITPVDEVVRMLLAENAGSAVVIDSGFVVGIFTTTDALRFISAYFGETKPNR
jgi:acetoin utilization protein AcuB